MTKSIEKAKGEGNAFPSTNAAITAHDFDAIDLRAKIKVMPSDSPKYAQFEGDVFETTVGRLLFNSVLPTDFPYLNEEITNKRMQSLVQSLVTHYKLDGIPAILDRIKRFGFRYATHAGITWSLSDVVVPKEKEELVAKGREDAPKELENYNG